MDNTQAQVLQNFRSLFGRYKAVITQNDRQIQINVDGVTTQINQPRAKQTQQQITRL